MCACGVYACLAIYYTVCSKLDATKNLRIKNEILYDLPFFGRFRYVSCTNAKINRPTYRFTNRPTYRFTNRPIKWPISQKRALLINKTNSMHLKCEVECHFFWTIQPFLFCWYYCCCRCCFGCRFFLLAKLKCKVFVLQWFTNDVL